jgi:taurine dioxygenase
MIRHLSVFLSGCGPLVFAEGELPVAGAPMLNVLSNVGRATPPISRFDTDSSYFACPPSFTALCPVSLPGEGGATLLSDQVRGARNLREGWRQCLDGRKVLHRCTGLDGIDEQNWNPFFWRRPVTGETALYLSTPIRSRALRGTLARVSKRRR